MKNVINFSPGANLRPGLKVFYNFSHTVLSIGAGKTMPGQIAFAAASTIP